jgi:signal peptidase II
MNKYLLLALIFGGVVLTDQASKYLAVGHLTRAFARDLDTTFGDRLHSFFHDRNLDGDPPTDPDLRTDPAVVLEDFWQFKYVENPGAAWGLLGRVDPKLRLPFFHLVSLAAIAFILYFYRRLKEEQRYLQVALAVVLGGAVGNYLDRMIRNYVIDFIDWHWFQAPNLHWPTFNIADSAICIGVGMMLAENAFASRNQPVVPTTTETSNTVAASTNASENSNSNSNSNSTAESAPVEAVAATSAEGPK